MNSPLGAGVDVMTDVMTEDPLGLRPDKRSIWWWLRLLSLWSLSLSIIMRWLRGARPSLAWFLFPLKSRGGSKTGPRLSGWFAFGFVSSLQYVIAAICTEFNVAGQEYILPLRKLEGLSLVTSDISEGSFSVHQHPKSDHPTIEIEGVHFSDHYDGYHFKRVICMHDVLTLMVV